MNTIQRNKIVKDDDDTGSDSSTEYSRSSGTGSIPRELLDEQCEGTKIHKEEDDDVGFVSGKPNAKMDESLNNIHEDTGALASIVKQKIRQLGYMRRTPIDEQKSTRVLRDRIAAEQTPELHFLGEILGGEGFASGIWCKFAVESGKYWTLLSGATTGQTHDVSEFVPWGHPFDLHYAIKSIQGWPRIMLQVWQLDQHGRNALMGYGFCHLPSTHGLHEMRVPCWRPSGTPHEETAAFFLGITPQLKIDDTIFNRAWDQRCRLVTYPSVNHCTTDGCTQHQLHEEENGKSCITTSSNNNAQNKHRNCY